MIFVHKKTIRSTFAAISSLLFSFKVVNLISLRVLLFCSFMTPCQKEYHATLLGSKLIYPKIMRTGYIRTHARTHKKNYKSQPILMNQLYIFSFRRSLIVSIFFSSANFNAIKTPNSIMYIKSL